MQTSLERIANKARKVKKYQFQNLYRELNEELLHRSWKKLNKKSAVGVDKVSYQDYDKCKEDNITELLSCLRAKRYKARLVKRKEIPKGNGKVRPLGIPVTEDKLLQYAVKEILEAVYEGDFLDSSYGYRQGRGAREAVDALKNELWVKRYRYVVEADIKGFFDNLNHEWIEKMLEQRIDDKAFMRLIKKWLKAGVLKLDGNVEHPTSGSPQGGVISPILSNIYMHYVLNLWFEKIVKKACKGNAYLCVYADDFVAAFENKEDAEWFYRELEGRMSKFGLELAKEKTNIIRFDKMDEASGMFEFLGFEFSIDRSKRTGRLWVKRATSRNKFKKSLTSFKEWCRENRCMSTSKIMKMVKAKLRGYYNYYGVIGNYEMLMKMYYFVTKVLYKWMNRRSQRKSYTWAGLIQLVRFYAVPRPRIVFTPSC